MLIYYLFIYHLAWVLVKMIDCRAGNKTWCHNIASSHCTAKTWGMSEENSFITPEATEPQNCKIGHRNGIDLAFQRAVVTRLIMFPCKGSRFLLRLYPILPVTSDAIMQRRDRLRLSGWDYTVKWEKVLHCVCVCLKKKHKMCHFWGIYWNSKTYSLNGDFSAKMKTFGNSSWVMQM